MINIESELFNAFADAMQRQFQGLTLSDEYNNVTSCFPLVTLEEKDNTVFEQTQSSDNIENHGSVMYELNVFSNKAQGKGREAKTIMAYADSLLAGYGFTRVMCTPVPNFEDSSIFRITARYRAVIDRNHTIYRR